MPQNNSITRLRQLSRQLTEAIEFGPLGSDVKWRKPYIGEHPGLPPGVAAFVPPTGVRRAGGQSPQARRAGAVLTSGKHMPDIAAKIMAKSAGYPDADSMNGALKRHEIVHSIQAAKDNYRMPRTIGQIFKNEVGAYATMNRGVTGGSKILRAANGVTGVATSTAIGALANPRTRGRALAYAGGAAAAGGGLLLANHLRKKDEDRKD